MRLLVQLLAVFLVTVQQGAFSHPWLLFANRKDIQLVDVTPARNRKNNVTVIIKDLEDAAALDYHYEKGMVCWTDISLEMIRCAYHQGANLLNKTNVITTGKKKISHHITMFVVTNQCLLSDRFGFPRWIGY